MTPPPASAGYEKDAAASKMSRIFDLPYAQPANRRVRRLEAWLRLLIAGGLGWGVLANASAAFVRSRPNILWI